MTVSTTNNKDTFVGTGAETALPTTFPFIDDSDLVVTKRVTATGVETTLTLSTHYTITGGDYAIGEVTPVDGATDFPSTVTWTIKRTTPKTQSADYVENDNFGAETHENALDKATYLSQDGQEEVDRSLKVAVSDANPGLLPVSIERASSYLGFDADGDPVALAAPADTAIVSTYIETLLDDTSATAARNTLDAMYNPFAARGDMIRSDNFGLAVKIAIGADAKYLRSDGDVPSWSALVAADVEAVQVLPRNYLAGLAITRTSATQFDVAKGVARGGSFQDQDLSDGKNTFAGFGKLFNDAGWSAGDGGGGVPAAAGFATAIATWHYFMLISSDGSAYDFGWDDDIIATNLRADAAVQAELGDTVNYRRIGSFVSTATPDFADFTQIGDEFLLAVPVLDYDSGSIDITASTNITLPSIPDDIRLKALLRVMHIGSTDDPLIIRSVDEDDAAPSSTVAPGGVVINGAAANAAGGNVDIWTNNNQRVFIRKGADNTSDTQIVTRGWIDRRGRDD